MNFPIKTGFGNLARPDFAHLHSGRSAEKFPPVGGMGDWGEPQQARLSYKCYACVNAAHRRRWRRKIYLLNSRYTGLYEHNIFCHVSISSVKSTAEAILTLRQSLTALIAWGRLLYISPPLIAVANSSGLLSESRSKYAIALDVPT